MNYFLYNKSYEKVEDYDQLLYNSQNFKFKSITSILYNISFLLKHSLNNIIKSFNQLDILFISRTRVLTTNFAGRNIKGDYLFGNIINSLINEYSISNILLVSTDFGPTSDTDNYKTQSLFEYVTFYTLVKSFVKWTKIYCIWMLNKKEIQRHLSKTGCVHFSLLFNHFFSFNALFSCILSDYCFENILYSFAPKVIVANDDVMRLKPNASLNTKFIIMQSALISPIREQFIRMFINIFSLFKYKVDSFLVVGEKFYKAKMIAEDSKKLIITGQPRYDVLFSMNKIYNKQLFIKKYNIDPSHKLVLWTTQCHGMSIDENKRNLETVFDNCKLLNNITLIIKQHPDENLIYTKIIYEYINKYNINVFFPQRDFDIYELLFTCDLLITKNSTTAMEFIALGKPVIVLNLSEEPDIIDYVDEGVAVGVYDKLSFKIAVEQLLKDDTRLAKNRESYIRNNIYKIDGKATKRVTQIILGML
ncbi:MAG: CDP-glycerol glycerophosphotransferase family protein [Euryarchaeota archaeon]|nr:CDP-glycerol glycerophosphotransferase family protein [Euryarchaeota archaeon]